MLRDGFITLLKILLVIFFVAVNICSVLLRIAVIGIHSDSRRILGVYFQPIAVC